MKKILFLSIGIATLMHNVSAAQISLFTTADDFSGFTSGADFTTASVTTSDLDGSTVNGIGNISTPGGTGTGGDLQLTWVSGGFDNDIFSQGEQGNAAFLSALETASTLTFQYTTPSTASGTYFQLGVLLNYDGHFVQQGWDSTTAPDINGVSTATINWATDGLGAAIAAQAIGAGITYFQFGVLYNSDYSPTASFNVDNFQVTTPVPEPSSLALIGFSAAGLVLFRRRNT